MNMHSEFPQHRCKDPQCNGEHIVHDQFPDSDLPGDALHEVKPLPEAPEPGVEVWIGSGRFHIEVNGGTYSVRRGA